MKRYGSRVYNLQAKYIASRRFTHSHLCSSSRSSDSIFRHECGKSKYRVPSSGGSYNIHSVSFHSSGRQKQVWNHPSLPYLALPPHIHAGAKSEPRVGSSFSNIYIYIYNHCLLYILRESGFLSLSLSLFHRTPLPISRKPPPWAALPAIMLSLQPSSSAATWLCVKCAISARFASCLWKLTR